MFVQMRSLLEIKLGQLMPDENGQTIVEYVLMIVLVGLAVVAAFPPIISSITGVFTKTSSALSQ